MIAYGHSDLSARLGVHLQLEHRRFKAAVRRIADACNAHWQTCPRVRRKPRRRSREYWRLGVQGADLPGNDVSTYLDGLKARAVAPMRAEIDRCPDALRRAATAFPGTSYHALWDRAHPARS